MIKKNRLNIDIEDKLDDLINEVPYLFRFVENPSDKVQMEMIRRNFSLIRNEDLDKISDHNLPMLIDRVPDFIGKIANPSDKILRSLAISSPSHLKAFIDNKKNSGYDISQYRKYMLLAFKDNKSKAIKTFYKHIDAELLVKLLREDAFKYDTHSWYNYHSGQQERSGRIRHVGVSYYSKCEYVMDIKVPCSELQKISNIKRTITSKPWAIFFIDDITEEVENWAARNALKFDIIDIDRDFKFQSTKDKAKQYLDCQDIII